MRRHGYKGAFEMDRRRLTTCSVTTRTAHVVELDLRESRVRTSPTPT